VAAPHLWREPVPDERFSFLWPPHYMLVGPGTQNRGTHNEDAFLFLLGLLALNLNPLSKALPSGTTLLFAYTPDSGGP
jgi:hypothetical protein